MDWSASSRCSSRSTVDLPEPALPITTARAGPASGAAIASITGRAWRSQMYSPSARGAVAVSV